MISFAAAHTLFFLILAFSFAKAMRAPPVVARAGLSGRARGPERL
jgi:hypothetical protein